jgi:mono/diheme cytochrome c family protein
MLNQDNQDNQDKVNRSLIRSRIGLTLCTVLILGSFILIACQKGSVTDSTSGPVSSTPGSGSGGSAPAATTEDTAVVDRPKGEPVPARDANGNPVSVDQNGRVTNLPITVSPAKPMLTPAPDPFPVRPTPAITMKGGKIVQQWEAPTEASALSNPVGNSAETLAMGKEFYNQRCVDCHGKEGKGNGWLSKGIFKPPTNLASRVVQANTDGDLFWKITNGKSPMPANRIRFTDEQRWQIVSYIRTFKP